MLELTRPRWHDEAQRQGIQITASLEAGPLPPVAGEPGSLREVLTNLVLNAVEAIQDHGTVTIKTWIADGRVYCSVSDTGAGMSEETRRQALEPFFTTKGPKSTGLGLSVNYGIIERHGGELIIESVQGRGSTITFALPVEAELADS